MAEALQRLTSHPHEASGRPPIAWLLLVAIPGIAVGAGLLFVLLPAFGYFPALGGTIVSLQPWRDLLAYPGLVSATRATLVSALVAVPIALGLAMLALAWIAPAGAPSSCLPRVAARVLSWLLALVSSVVPFGFVLLDRRLKREATAAAPSAA
jgi:putative thiamine transport system permease protein